MVYYHPRPRLFPCRQLTLGATLAEQGFLPAIPYSELIVTFYVTSNGMVTRRVFSVYTKCHYFDDNAVLNTH